MSMDLRSKFMLIWDLESNINAAQQIYKRELARLEELQDNCNHELIIVSKIPYPGYSIKAKCLCCGKRYSVPHELNDIPNAFIIEACNCREFRKYSEDKIYNCIEQQADSIICLNPDMTMEILRDDLRKFIAEKE